MPGGLTRQQASLSYDKASRYDGMPQAMVDRVDEIMDNRLAPSSWRKVRAGLKVCAPLAPLGVRDR